MFSGKFSCFLVIKGETSFLCADFYTKKISRTRDTPDGNSITKRTLLFIGEKCSLNPDAEEDKCNYVLKINKKLQQDN